MILLSFVIVLFSILISLPAWTFCIKQNKFLWWDYGMAIYPILLWFFLVYFRIGDQSLANVIELLFIGFLIVVTSYTRAFFLNRFFDSPSHISIISITLLLITVIVLRLAMPHIPE